MSDDCTAWERVEDALEDLFEAAGQDEYRYGVTDEGYPVGTLTPSQVWAVLHLLLVGATPETWKRVAKVTGGAVPPSGLGEAYRDRAREPITLTPEDEEKVRKLLDS